MFKKKKTNSQMFVCTIHAQQEVWPASSACLIIHTRHNGNTCIFVFYK